MRASPAIGDHIAFASINLPVYNNALITILCSVFVIHQVAPQLTEYSQLT